PEVFYSNIFNSIRVHFWYFCLRYFIRIDLILFEYIYLIRTETCFVRTETRFSLFPFGVGCIF
ncbi:hypothetical protein GIB67_037761, partial [Kingdonia uniflora]